MTSVHTGSCLCGAVSFRTSGPLRGVVYCHCSQCRKQSGHFFAATNVADDAIVVTGGDKVNWYAASAKAQARLLPQLRLGAVLEAQRSRPCLGHGGRLQCADRAAGRVPHLRRGQGRLLRDRRRLPQFERSTPSIGDAERLHGRSQSSRPRRCAFRPGAGDKASRKPVPTFPDDGLLIAFRKQERRVWTG